MPIIYSLLQADAEHTAISWWADAFGDDPAIITAAFHSDPQHFERTAVAQASHGRLHAAITYWIRLLCDATGVPRRVAQIWGVGHTGRRSQCRAARSFILAVLGTTLYGRSSAVPTTMHVDVPTLLPIWTKEELWLHICSSGSHSVSY